MFSVIRFATGNIFCRVLAQKHAIDTTEITYSKVDGDESPSVLRHELAS